MRHETSLPHSTNKIDLGVAVLTFLKDKLVFAPKGSTEHVTVHLGSHSKTVDVHGPRRVTGGIEEHETLFVMPHADLGLIGEVALSEFVGFFMTLFRPLRIGWLARHHISVEPAFFPMGTECSHIVSVKKKRLCMDEEKILDSMGRLKYLEDLFDLPNWHAFSLISGKNQFSPKTIGVGFKIDDPLVGAKLIWCSNKRLSRGFEAMFHRLESALIPPN